MRSLSALLKAYGLAVLIGLLLVLLLVPVYGFTVVLVLLFSAIHVLVFALPPVAVAAVVRRQPMVVRLLVAVAVSIGRTGVFAALIAASGWGTIDA